MNDDVAYFLEFQETEKDASPLTIRNYSAALKVYVEWRGSDFNDWRKEQGNHFRDYLFFLMKEDMKRSTIRLRFAALRSFYK